MDTDPQQEDGSTEGKQQELGTAPPQPVRVGDEYQPSPQQETGKPEQQNAPLVEKPLRWYQGWHFNRELDAVNATASLIGVFALFLLAYQTCELRRTNVIAEKSLKVATDALEDARLSGIETANRADRAIKTSEDFAEAAREQAEASKQSAESGKEALREARETAIADQRAWVFGGEVTGFNPVGNRLSAVIQFRNIGRTKATNVKGWMCSEIRDSPLPDNAIQSGSCRNISFGVLPPNIILRITQADLKKVFDSDLSTKLSQKTAHLYVFGVIEYDIHTGKHCTTRFCFKNDGNYLAPCENNNEAN